jgi:hypothetical protein
MDEYRPESSGSEIFKHARSQIANLESILGQQKGASQERALLNDLLFCLRTFMTYYAEAHKAVQANAWFAASAISGAALEAMLLYRCLLRPNDIKALPRWNALRKNHKDDFQVFIRLMDLGKLLEIAEQLSWFPSGDRLPRLFSLAFATHASETMMDAIQDLFSGTQNIGQACAQHVRNHRNLLHPAVCLKQAAEPSVEAGMTATLMFLIACSALHESGQI